MTLRVNQLARDLDVSNNSVIEVLSGLGISHANSHSSSLSRVEEDAVRAEIKRRISQGLLAERESPVRAEGDTLNSPLLPKSPQNTQAADRPNLPRTPEGGLPWFFDESGYYSYILLSAPADIRDQVLELLKQAGFNTTNGPSHRPAQNRVQYAHYIRVTHRTNLARVKWGEVSDLLIAALGPSKAPEHQKAIKPILVKKTPDRPQGVSAHPSSLDQQLSDIRLELKKVTEDRDLYAKLLEAVDQDSKEDHKEKEVVLLREEVGRQLHRIEELQSEVSELTVERNVANENLTTIREEWARQSQLPSGMETMEDEDRSENDLFELALKLLLPQIDLHPAAATQLYTEIKNPEHVLRLLGAINNGGEIKWDDRIEGSKHLWLEAHFTKNRNHDGRLYATRRKKESQPWYVCLSDKHDQRRELHALDKRI